jgi:hypothetical protein
MIRTPWWPVGHHLLPADTSLTKDDQMTLQQALDLAELEADRADEELAQALDLDEHPELIDSLRTEATIARYRYYDALHADLAL